MSDTVIAPAATRGMVSLKVDLSEARVADALAAVGGTSPEALAIAMGDVAVAWMAPDEVLILTPDPYGASVEIAQALAGVPHLALDVSDARVETVIEGPRTREVLAKLAPVDLSPAAMPVGAFRRTRLAQIPAALWLSADDRAHVLCFRSVAVYARDVLALAARPGGEIGLFRQG